MNIKVLLVALVASVAALPAETEMPEPGELALLLNEEEFEDYLDAWLAVQEPKWGNVSLTATRSTRQSDPGCLFRVNGDLGQPQPVYLRGGKFLSAANNAGQILVNEGEEIRIACTGNGRIIQHPDKNPNAEDQAVANVRCLNNNIVYAEGWLENGGEYVGLTCSTNAEHGNQATGGKCFNDNIVVRTGFMVDGVFHTWYYSCFDEDRMEVLYVWYNQNAAHTVHQTNVARPSWLVGTFHRLTGVNNLYTQVSQKEVIAGIVGQELADYYVTTRQFLARGHLAAKSDFVFATGQRSSFYFINAAPQWQPFNAGNWNWLEQNLRARIGQAGYDTIIYTGTFGVTQLRDESGQLHDIYLHPTEKKLPIPLYFYKIAYDASRRLGTAFVSINNPYYTADEVRELQFCTDRCRNNNAFSWLNWQPDRIDIGYSFCCTISDFQKVVPHLPEFYVDGLLS